MEIQSVIDAGVKIIQKVISFKPEVGMILGSGLGDYADKIEDAVMIPYSDIEGFPVSTVTGHAGQFVLGRRQGKYVIAMQGRVHYYEGYSQDAVTIPVRIMKQLGVEKIILTNAAGGVNPRFKPGDLMLITDHINYSGSNPLIGKNLDEYGPRFPDMSQVYCQKYYKKLKECMIEKEVSLQEGVYMMLSGPCYETPAEIRMARTVGADAVGMSTVPEAIVCSHCGISVLGISCITNMAAGILEQPLNHQEVVETAGRVKTTFVDVIDTILGEVF